MQSIEGEKDELESREQLQFRLGDYILAKNRDRNAQLEGNAAISVDSASDDINARLELFDTAMAPLRHMVETNATEIDSVLLSLEIVWTEAEGLQNSCIGVACAMALCSIFHWEAELIDADGCVRREAKALAEEFRRFSVFEDEGQKQMLEALRKLEHGDGKLEILSSIFAESSVTNERMRESGRDLREKLLLLQSALSRLASANEARAHSRCLHRIFSSISKVRRGTSDRGRDQDLQNIRRTLQDSIVLRDIMGESAATILNTLDLVSAKSRALADIEAAMIVAKNAQASVPEILGLLSQFLETISAMRFLFQQSISNQISNDRSRMYLSSTRCIKYCLDQWIAAANSALGQLNNLEPREQVVVNDFLASVGELRIGCLRELEELKKTAEANGWNDIYGSPEAGDMMIPWMDSTWERIFSHVVRSRMSGTNEEQSPSDGDFFSFTLSELMLFVHVKALLLINSIPQG